MGKQLAFHVDLSACVGCKACQVACKEKHGLPVGILWRRVIEYGDGNWIKKGDCMVPDNVFSYFVSVSCNHCEKPLCAGACPTGAILKREDNGVVFVDENECTGCWECLDACPYGAPQSNGDAQCMSKCTLCYDLIDEGKNPACADACPMRAISYGDLDDLKARFGRVSAVEPLPASEITRPSLVLTPHKDSQASGTGTGRILNLEGEI
jgi:anaerobic dimethyl sulfoxide reductase subunit B